MPEKFEAEAQAVQKFVDVCTECQCIFTQKNFQYGNSIEDTGAFGAIVTLIGDVARFRRLVFAKLITGDILWTKVREVLIDCHNYSAIAIMMIDKKNYYGRNYDGS